VKIAVAVQVAQVDGEREVAGRVGDGFGEAALSVAQDDGGVRGARVGRDDVHVAVAVDVARGDHPGVAPGRYPGMEGDSPCAVAQEEEDLLAVEGTHEEVEDAVTVGVGGFDGGLVLALAIEGRVRPEGPRAVVHQERHRAVALPGAVGRGDVGKAVAVQVEHRHPAHLRVGLVVLDRAERSVAGAQKDAQLVVLGIAQREVDMAVPVEVGALVGTGACALRDRVGGERPVAARTVVEKHTDVVGDFVGHREVRESIFVEVAGVGPVGLDVPFEGGSPHGDAGHLGECEPGRSRADHELPGIAVCDGRTGGGADLSVEGYGHALSRGKGPAGREADPPSRVFEREHSLCNAGPPSEDQERRRVHRRRVDRAVEGDDDVRIRQRCKGLGGGKGFEHGRPAPGLCRGPGRRYEARARQGEREQSVAQETLGE
jgi:hypothetical protein